MSYLIDGDPFERLLWREIKHTMKKAKLTVWQAAVFQLYLQGLSTRQIGIVYGRPYIVIHEYLEAARSKMLVCPHRGVLTVMIESLGWSAVNEALAEKIETESHKHRMRFRQAS